MSGHRSSPIISPSSQGSPRPEPRHLSRHSHRHLGRPAARHAMLVKRVFLATPYSRMHSTPTSTSSKLSPIRRVPAELHKNTYLWTDTSLGDQLGYRSARQWMRS